MQAASYRIVIDKSLCAGTSNCVEDAPEVYEIGEDGLARVKNPAADSSAVLAGAEACPVQAIFLFDPISNKQVYP
jgi:ferredoxin